MVDVVGDVHVHYAVADDEVVAGVLVVDLDDGE